MVQYYEEIGKPTPKVDVMEFLKGKEYVDAKNFAGECEPVVIIAKGQSRGFHLFTHFDLLLQANLLLDVGLNVNFSGQMFKGHASMGRGWITFWLHRTHHTSLFPGHTLSSHPKVLLIIT